MSETRRHSMDIEQRAPMTNLTDLARRVSELQGPSREVEEAIYEALGNCNHKRTERYAYQDDTGFTCLDCGKDTYGAATAPRYTASLDAAMTLVPEGMPWSVNYPANDDGSRSCHGIPTKPSADVCGIFGLATTPALALTAAALIARSEA